MIDAGSDSDPSDLDLKIRYFRWLARLDNLRSLGITCFVSALKKIYPDTICQGSNPWVTQIKCIYAEV